MSTGSVPDGDAVEQRLFRVLEHLVESEDHRGIVRLVEKWSERGELPIEVLRSQASALIALRLMDRAWVRLREAAELDASDTETQLLTAEMFVERGWPARARRILERIDVSGVDDRRLSALQQAAAQAPLQPPESAQEIETSTDPAAVMGLAERYMAAGSFVRAQSLLERLHREGRGGRRVADLLWAIQGDFGSGKVNLEDLLQELSPEDRLSEWDGIELTESLRVREETHHDPEAAARELLAADMDKDESPAAFPDLFRHGEMPDETTLHDDDEVTVASSMATRDQMGESSADQHTDPGMAITGDGGDTRIMEVIGQEIQDMDSVRPIHRPVDPMTSAGAELGSTLDLRSYRDSMGVDGLTPDADTFLEEEDQDLIVMTRREARHSAAPVRRTSPTVEVVEKGVSGTRKPLPQEPEGEIDLDPYEEVAVPPVPKRRRGLQLAAWVGVVTFGMGLVGWVVLFGLHRVAGRQVIDETHRVLANGHFRSIQELEAKLDSELKAESEPYEVRVAELALVRAVLWSEYTGDSDRLAAVEQALSEDQLPDNERFLIEGFLSLTRGDLVTAQSYAEQVSVEDALGRILVAKVALSRGQRAAMEAAWTRVGGMSVTAGPMVELLAVEALADGLGEMGVVETIRAQLLSEYADSAMVQLARFENGWDTDTAPTQLLVHLASARDSVRGALSPREAGRFHMIRSHLAAEIGLDTQAKNAWRRALDEDPTHPQYLYKASLESVHENRLVASEDDLRRCLEARPWDRSCRRGTVQVLIDLDRLVTARQRVEGFKGPGVDVAHLEAWIMLAAGAPQDALDTLGARGREGGVAAFVESMARAELNAPEADAGLRAVVAELEDSNDRLDRILAARAEAARMRFVPSAERAEVEAKAVRLGPSDPGVHVLLGRFFDSEGRRGDAADSFDLGARMGVENAVAHHARGLHYFDPKGDMTQAKSAWTRYLALQPEGPRAQRTQERLRLR